MVTPSITEMHNILGSRIIRVPMCQISERTTLIGISSSDKVNPITTHHLSDVVILGREGIRISVCI